MRFLTIALLSLVLVVNGGVDGIQVRGMRADSMGDFVLRDRLDVASRLLRRGRGDGLGRGSRGPCRGLSVRGTIRCAVALWPVSGGVGTALGIARRESRFLPWEASPSGTYRGIYQICGCHMPKWPNNLMQGPWWERWFPNLVRDDPNMLFKGRFNVMLAIRYAHLHGWGPWR